MLVIKFFTILKFSSWLDPGGVNWGDFPFPLKPMIVTLFTMILYNLDNSICDIRLFFLSLFCHSSVVKCNSSLLQ